MNDNTLCSRSATDLASLIRSREVSAAETLATHASHIVERNGAVNALVSLDLDTTCDTARAGPPRRPGRLRRAAGMAGSDAADPLSAGLSGIDFTAPLTRDLTGLRLAWSMTPCGAATEPRVTVTLAPARAVLEGLGCIVEEACPEIGDLLEVQHALRAWTALVEAGPLVEAHGDAINPELRRAVEAGRALGIAKSDVCINRIDFTDRFFLRSIPTAEDALCHRARRLRIGCRQWAVPLAALQFARQSGR